MKMNMMKVWCTLVVILLSASLYAQDASKLIGSWRFSAPEAPYGYQEGAIYFKQANGKLSAELKIQGSVVKIEEIKQDGHRYACHLYMEGTPVSIEIIQKEKELEGQADAGGGIIPVTFKRDKK